MSRPKCYHTMDAFVKLVVVLVRYSGEPTNTLAKVNLLNKVRVFNWYFAFQNCIIIHVKFFFWLHAYCGTRKRALIKLVNRAFYIPFYPLHARLIVSYMKKQQIAHT